MAVEHSIPDSFESPEIPGVEFRAVPEWPGYFASSDGWIWMERVAKTDPEKVRIRVLSGWFRRGYRFVSVSNGTQRCNRAVHRLVLEAFVGPKPEGQQCRHLNGCSHDNSVTNLAWGTSKENAADKKTYKLRLVPPMDSEKAKEFTRVVFGDEIEEWSRDCGITPRLLIKAIVQKHRGGKAELFEKRKKFGMISTANESPVLWFTGLRE